MDQKLKHFSTWMVNVHIKLIKKSQESIVVLFQTNVLKSIWPKGGLNLLFEAQEASFQKCSLLDM